MPANKHLPNVQAMFVGVAHSYAASCAIWAQFAIYRPTPTPSCDLSASFQITGEKQKIRSCESSPFPKGLLPQTADTAQPFQSEIAPVEDIQRTGKPAGGFEED